MHDHVLFGHASDIPKENREFSSTVLEDFRGNKLPAILGSSVFGYMIANQLLVILDSVTTFWLTVGISLLLAWLIHVWMERPLVRALKGLLELLSSLLRAKR